MPTPPILILTAVGLEANAVADALNLRRPKPGQTARRQVRGMPVEIAIVGIRAKHLAQLSVDAGSIVVMTGFAGALDPALEVGMIVAEDLPAGRPAPAGWRIGTILTSGGIVATPAAKHDLFARTGALAVEMENDAVRAWCVRNGAEFLAIRAISDRADQSLDPVILQCVDSWGRPRPLSIASALLRKPRLILELMRLGRDSKRAGQMLGIALADWLEAQRQDSCAAPPPGR